MADAATATCGYSRVRRSVADGRRRCCRRTGERGDAAGQQLGVLRSTREKLDFISRLMELEDLLLVPPRGGASRDGAVRRGGPARGVRGYETIPYHVTASGSVTEEGISQWSLCESVTPGMYSTDDYDFRKPNAWMLQARQNPVSPVPGAVDVYDWPGHFVDHSHGEFYAHPVRGVAAHHSVSGTGTATGIAPGYRFGIVNAPHFSDNGEYR